MDQNQPIVRVDSIHKSYPKVKALEGVSLQAETGKILALLGPNGAGKTTLIKILTTLLPPDSGKAIVAGLDVVRDASRVRQVTGLAGQFAAVDENLTAKENLELVGTLYHLPGAEIKERTQNLLGNFGLQEASKRLVKTYSGGMRRRLDLAASLISRPKILFLDEPTTGLDPASRIQLWKIIKQLVAQGSTIFLTTQHMEEAEQLADTIVVIDKGKLIAQGTPAELKASIGGDFIEFHTNDPRRAFEAAKIVSEITHYRPQFDKETGQVVVPARAGTKVIVQVVRALDQRRIEIRDISLHKPTLDDVFLTLTGHKT